MRNKHSAVRPVSEFVSEPGSRIHDILEPRFNGETTRLVATGQEDIQDRIEAQAPYCDITYMLHRLSLGDQSVVTTRQAMYGDFSGLPRDPVEAINMVNQAEMSFAALSVEDKAKYNNDWRVWFSAILSGTVPPSEGTPVDVPSETLTPSGGDSDA